MPSAAILEQKKQIVADVTEKLKENNLTYKWLLCILQSKGMNVSTVSLSKWVHGVQIAQTAYDAHDLSIKIINLHVKSFVKKVGNM